MKKCLFVRLIPVAFVLLVISGEAFAGGAGSSGGSFIQPLLNFIVDSLKGYVGTVIGVTGLLYGLVSGIARGSMGGLGVGVGLAVAAYYGPDIITSLSGATLYFF